jgi:hypothetical protein
MEQQILNSLRQSIYRIILVLVHFLPGVLAFLVAVILFSLIGLGLAALLRRLLTAASFDERLAARRTPDAVQTWSPADWAPASSPTLPSTPPTRPTRSTPSSCSRTSPTSPVPSSSCWPERCWRASSPARS